MLRGYLFGALILLLAAPAAAHENGRFGDPGVVVPAGRVALTFTHVQPPEGEGAWQTALELHPGALFFITRNVALGGSLLIGWHTSGKGDERVHGTLVGLEPRLGYNVVISNGASFFPTLGFGWRRQADQTGNEEAARAVGSRIFIDVELPILGHFGNYFIGGGPFVRADLSSKVRVGLDGDSVDANKLTEIGVQTVLGGWL